MLARGRKGANVAAQVAAVGRVQAVGAHHHGHGVPAHVGAQALFDGDVAGAARLLLGLDGVHIARVGRKRQVNAVLARMFQQLLQQVVGAFGTLFLDDGGQGLHPFAGFLLVGVVGGGGPCGSVLLGGHARLLGLWWWQFSGFTPFLHIFLIFQIAPLNFVL
jgi:hypothetical protein